MSPNHSPELHYADHNPAGHSIVVLVHGAFACGHEWDPVIPYLCGYHLLVPDLPGHGKSQTIPFSVELAVDLIAALIRRHAISGSAHIIGHSLGANIVICLAVAHPEVVKSAFVSGFSIAISSRNVLTPYIPYAFWAVSRLGNCVPRSWVRWAMDGADIPRTDTNVCTLELCRQIFASTSAAWPAPWRVRTLIIAAGKGGVIPTNDSAHDAAKLMGIGRRLNPQTVAYSHPEMRHPWNCQAPRLFAETVDAWFKERELPAGLVKL